MIKEEVSQYIIDKKIPLRILWKDNHTYHLECYINDYNTSGSSTYDKKYLFPNWNTEMSKGTNEIYYFNNKTNKMTIFNFDSISMEECLTEFLYWFELNKHKCKQIFYYDKNKGVSN